VAVSRRSGDEIHPKPPNGGLRPTGASCDARKPVDPGAYSGHRRRHLELRARSPV